LILIFEDRLPKDFLALAGGAWAEGPLRFPAFLIDGPVPQLVAAVLDKSASGTQAKMGTAKIVVSGASSKPRMWEMKLFRAYRELDVVQTLNPY
jgi:hypothetical protein